MANEYDKILRDNFREPKMNLLRLLLQEAAVSIQPLVPSVQQTIFERETDTLAEITTDEGRQFILHIEWQSANDGLMAKRMAMYDLMLHQTYGKDVLGIVLYVGDDKLRMKESFSFFQFRYRCRILDVRLLDPEIFLQSDDAGEVIFAILAGQGDDAEKEKIIRRIFSKLQLIFKNDPTTLQIKIKQLEILSLLRGETVQQKIIEEEQTMPVTIDITKDIRYQQGIEQGKEQGKELGREQGIEQERWDNATKMLENGIDISLVHNITGIAIYKLEELEKSLDRGK